MVKHKAEINTDAMRLRSFATDLAGQIVMGEFPTECKAMYLIKDIKAYVHEVLDCDDISPSKQEWRDNIASAIIKAAPEYVPYKSVYTVFSNYWGAGINAYVDFGFKETPDTACEYPQTLDELIEANIPITWVATFKNKYNQTFYHDGKTESKNLREVICQQYTQSDYGDSKISNFSVYVEKLALSPGEMDAIYKKAMDSAEKSTPDGEQLNHEYVKVKNGSSELQKNPTLKSSSKVDFATEIARDVKRTYNIVFYKGKYWYFNHKCGCHVPMDGGTRSFKRLVDTRFPVFQDSWMPSLPSVNGERYMYNTSKALLFNDIVSKIKSSIPEISDINREFMSFQDKRVRLSDLTCIDSVANVFDTSAVDMKYVNTIGQTPIFEQALSMVAPTDAHKTLIMQCLGYLMTPDISANKAIVSNYSSNFDFISFVLERMLGVGGVSRCITINHDLAFLRCLETSRVIHIPLLSIDSDTKIDMLKDIIYHNTIHTDIPVAGATSNTNGMTATIHTEPTAKLYCGLGQFSFHHRDAMKVVNNDMISVTMQECSNPEECKRLLENAIDAEGPFIASKLLLHYASLRDDDYKFLELN